jgi:hypothetical protein
MTAHPAQGDARAVSKTYRIVVRGVLSERFATSLDNGFRVTPRDGGTELVAEVVDQSQLHGLLDRLLEVGLDLVSLDEVQR